MNNSTARRQSDDQTWTRKRSAVATAIMTLALGHGLAACGDVEPRSSAPAADDSLSIVQADETAGKLVLQYEKGGRAITFEMRLGPKMLEPPTAEELAANPELPTYEVDARVLDMNGQPIHMQMGGDTFVDSGWAMPRIEGFDQNGRLMDFRLMKDAVPALRTLAVPAGLEQLRLSALEIGNSVVDVVQKPGVEVPAPVATLSSAAKAPLDPNLAVAQQAVVLASGPSSVVKWDFVVRKKCFPTCSTGNHSAVALRGWSASTSIVYLAYSCNHGTCASDTTVMQDHCVMPGFKTDDRTHTRFFYSDGCTTRYNVTSILGHNCNDDSELQGRAIWNDSSQSTTGGSCNSLGLHNWAPGCTY